MFDDKAFLWALGTMSGTSLDGVDAAMLLTNGDEIADFGPAHYRAYTAQEQAVLRRALGQWQDGPDVPAATKVMQAAHIEVLSRFEGADLIGFHGQTFAHDPAGRGTHQAGDGAHLAQALKVPVVWDFRSADVAAGGQGAPLAPFFHHALARHIGADAPIAFLNLGGVGNITWVDPTRRDPADPLALLAFDTGPANAPINDLMQARLGLPFDEGGALAAKGEVNEAVIAQFEANPFFAKAPPKSLDRDDFKALLTMVEGLPDADAAATLTHACALSVIKAALHFPRPVSRLLVTGGGRLNPVIMQTLAQGLGCKVEPVEAAGLNGDMLEAQAFAYLAVRALRGLPLSSPQTTAVPTPISGGRLSHWTQSHKAD